MYACSAADTATRTRRHKFAWILTLMWPSVLGTRRELNGAGRVQSGLGDRNTKWMFSPALPLSFQMDRCQQQLEQGLPPCPEMEEEWRRMLRDKKRRQRDKEERERVKKHMGTHQRSLVGNWLKQWGERQEDRVTKKERVDAGAGNRLRFWGTKGVRRVPEHAHGETGKWVENSVGAGIVFTTCQGQKGQSGWQTEAEAVCTYRDQPCLKPVQLSAAHSVLSSSLYSHPAYSLWPKNPQYPQKNLEKLKYLSCIWKVERFAPTFPAPFKLLLKCKCVLWTR